MTAEIKKINNDERQRITEALLLLSQEIMTVTSGEKIGENLISGLKKLSVVEEVIFCIQKQVFSTLSDHHLCDMCKTEISRGDEYHCPYYEEKDHFKSHPVRYGENFYGFIFVQYPNTDFDISPFLRNLSATTATMLGHLQEKIHMQKAIDTLNRAQEVTHAGHWELNLVKNNLYWSDEVYRIFGLRPQEFGATYEAFLERIHPDDREKVNAAYSNSLKEKKPYQIGHRIIQMDGSIRYVEEKCVHEFDLTGNIIRSIGTVHDVTERILAENYRKKNEQSKDLLLALNREADNLSEKELCDRTLNIVVQITDSKVGYLYMLNDDRKTVSLISWYEEALKKYTAPYESLYPPEEASIWADCVRQGKTIVNNDHELVARRTDLPTGNFPIKRYISTPVIDKNEIRMIVGVGNKEDQYNNDDVRQIQFVADEVLKFIMRKRAEEALALINRELEKRVKKEVDQRIMHEQLLVQQSRMAAMGEMIGAITHQWKQPLSHLSLIVQEIQDAYEYDELNEEHLNNNVKSALEAISFLSQTIEDFRNFFKPIKEKEVFLACETTEDILKIVGTQFEKHNIQLVIEKHEHFYSFGYPSEFKQVMLNIFNNSRDALEERDIPEKKIHVTFSHDSKTGIIRIRDNGGGIPEELLPDKLFEPYITTKREQGTGIGLQICKMIIETHMNGKISARNTEDGAEFTIQIPLYREKQE